MRFKLIEPLRELFKDEVRLLGQELGLPKEMIQRQPFPGPGLAIRVLGAVTEDRLKVLRAADVIVLDEIRAAGLYEKIWQSFVVLLPIKTVGVVGDERSYENVVALRVVDSQTDDRRLGRVAGRAVGADIESIFERSARRQSRGLRYFINRLLPLVGIRRFLNLHSRQCSGSLPPLAVIMTQKIPPGRPA